MTKLLKYQCHFIRLLKIHHILDIIKTPPRLMRNSPFWSFYISIDTSCQKPWELFSKLLKEITFDAKLTTGNTEYVAWFMSFLKIETLKFKEYKAFDTRLRWLIWLKRQQMGFPGHLRYGCLGQINFAGLLFFFIFENEMS